MVTDRSEDLGGHSAGELAQLDRDHVWHPFTPMRRYGQIEPVIVARGDGVRVEDIQGTVYLDATSAIWLNIHGHRIPEIDDAIRTQLDRIAHSTLLGQGNVPSILLATRLAELAPTGLEHVFFVDNGAGAVEAAIKMAVQFHANTSPDRTSPRRFVMGFTGNYHGDTLGAVGVAPDDLFHAPFLGLLPGHPRVPFPGRGLDADPERARERSLETAARTLAERGDIAAVIVEPVEGAGVIIPAPAGFLKGLRALCDEHGVLLIVDEVATGFGRTGTMFACDTEGVSPDLLCVGKGLTGGYLPVGATIASTEVYETFLGEPSEAKTFFHGHSYTGNPLGCAAALANLDLLETLLPSLPAKVDRIADQLAPIAADPFVADVRQAGFMVGIELMADRASGRRFAPDALAAWAIVEQARNRGMLIRPIGDVLIFMPPPGASHDELREMTSILRTSFVGARPELERLAG